MPFEGKGKTKEIPGELRNVKASGVAWRGLVWQLRIRAPSWSSPLLPVDWAAAADILHFVQRIPWGAVGRMRTTHQGGGNNDNDNDDDDDDDNNGDGDGDADIDRWPTLTLMSRQTLRLRKRCCQRHGVCAAACIWQSRWSPQMQHATATATTTTTTATTTTAA
ncbi:hypothetical protein ACLKA6_005487 [Drosophila palustris]